MEKQQIEALAKQYEQLQTGFENIEKTFKRICKDNFLGFKYHDLGDSKALVGFGGPLFLEWQFVIHNGKGFGVLKTYSDYSHQNDLPGFYDIFFRGGIPVFIRDLGQETVNFYGNQLMDMEDMLSEIIGAFLEQDCFRG